MAKDLLKKAKGKRVAPKAKKSGIRHVVISEDQPDYDEVFELIEIASLTGDLKPLESQRKSVVQERLFDRWAKEMWDGQKKPENFKAVIKNQNGLDDARCNFVLKVNARGLRSVVPQEDDLPEDQTVQEFLVETIVDQCGLTPDNAKKFVDGEISIFERYTFCEGMSLNEMYYGSDPKKKKIARLFLTYAQARAGKRSRSGKVSVEAFTDELEIEAIGIEQVVEIKDGMVDRVFTYCDSLDQLRKLLSFCNVTKQVSNFEFAISDDPKTKHERRRAIVDKYLVPKADS